MFNNRELCIDSDDDDAESTRKSSLSNLAAKLKPDLKRGLDCIHDLICSMLKIESAEASTSARRALSNCHAQLLSAKKTVDRSFNSYESSICGITAEIGQLQQEMSNLKTLHKSKCLQVYNN